MSLLKTLWRGGRVLSPTSPDATAMLVEGDRIAWIGPDDEAPAADETVELDRALVTPAFVDSHVHLTGAGASLIGLHLAGLPSARATLDKVAGFAAALPDDAIVLAHGWDETTWDDPTLPTPEEVENAAGGRLAYLSRTCGHTGIAGPRVLDAHPDLYTLDHSVGTGVLKRMAHKAARGYLNAQIPVSQRLATAQAALERAASLGIAALAEHTIPTRSDPHTEAEFTGLIALGAERTNPAVHGWWGELCAAAKARDIGAHGCGGDLSIDGSLGARTAYLRTPYRDDDTTGVQYFTSSQVRDHLADCHRHGLPAAFHAIGDGAISTVLDGLDLAEQAIGIEAIRQARHRIEHAELLDAALTARMVHYGIHASVQPAFDAAWGGADGMYAARLGTQAALNANPFSRMAGVGVPLAFGSDAPVTPLDPWGGVRAAVRHHNPTLRLSLGAAFTAATKGGWRALGVDDSGSLSPGMRADFTVWDLTDGALPDLSDPLTPDPKCAVTVAEGHVIHRRS
ncbi:amidohydrolase family protein [Glycomyces sp. L485]|uniref:amidohydrolase n=1 Tax=Glycomyces sp. L485 TaxID=2909235 RepID=UPI001F4B53D9|nr:amidohydrolase family protein [Glycomyces sp. L485]MCH7231529.1 amidohydrolase family protein [Glycomyces sp. L485]